jgi:hypothetical protein
VTSQPPDTELLTARVRVPEHVVYREFADDTVILNLKSGMYHGMNATAARMLEELSSSASVGDAVETLASELEAPRDVIERDVVGLCRTLEERGLIARDGGTGSG